MDDWWRRHFALLLDREQSGADPKTLADRWLVLNILYAGRKGHPARISFRLPEDVAHFLDDADIRSKDHTYAAAEWASARRWLNG